MEASEQLSVITTITKEARERGLCFQFIGDERLAGRRVTLGGVERREHEDVLGELERVGLEMLALLGCDLLDLIGTR